MSSQSSAPGRRTVLRVVAGCFTPDGHSVSNYITAKFKERVCASGHTWRHVSKEMRDFYYDEFIKKYTWEEGHEQEFKETWNDVCATRYKDLLYKCRRKGTRPWFIPEDIWNSWRAIWAAEKWQSNAHIARANRNTELAGPSTGSSKHTAGSRSIVEHTLDMENELQRPPTCWEIFSKTHKSKDGTFVDKRAEAFEAELNARFEQASQPTVEGGERQTLTNDQINQIYYDVVGGKKKSSTLYGLGSQAKVVYDREMAPRARGRPSGSSSDVTSLREENQDLKNRLSALEAQQRAHDQQLAEMRALIQNMSVPPLPPGCTQSFADFLNDEPQDPNAPDQ
ncbi:uncharacterized protein LOC141832603 [Curcuma longa]|uniref:uncharacterized protein LOC141832603 n=1 Tax=Curcuma longa TaxID=136217 RepID=UPI003D9F2960